MAQVWVEKKLVESCQQVGDKWSPVSRVEGKSDAVLHLRCLRETDWKSVRVVD